MINSSNKKRSLDIRGHKTSATMEDQFWRAFKAIARRRGVSLSTIAEQLDQARTGGLSSAIRVFVLEEAQADAARAQERPAAVQ